MSKKKISPFPGPKFPEILGKGSKMRSNSSKLTICSKYVKISPKAFRLDYVSHIYTIFMNILIKGTKDDINNAVKLLKDLHMTRDDFFDIIEKVIMKTIAVPSKNKSAFTRAYNKSVK
jgi:hypothetical protein